MPVPRVESLSWLFREQIAVGGGDEVLSHSALGKKQPELPKTKDEMFFFFTFPTESAEEKESKKRPEPRLKGN